MKPIIRLAALASLVGLLTSCATPPPALLPRLSAPPWPTLPTVSATEAEPIPFAVWERIVTRDRLLRNSLYECHAILDATAP